MAHKIMAWLFVRKMFYFLNKKKSLKLALLASSNLVISFIVQLATINILGPGQETDALLLGISIPIFILSITMGPLSNVLVPMFAQDKEDSELLGSLLLMALCIGILIFTILYISIDLWLPLLVSEFDTYKYDLVKSFCLLQIFSIPLALLNSVLWSYLNGKKHHFESEIAPAITGIFCLPFLLVSISCWGAWVLAIWYPTRFAMNALLLYRSIYKLNFNVRFKVADYKEIMSIWKKVSYLLLGSAYYKTEPIVDRTLLFKSDAGQLSLFSLSQQIYNSASQVIIKSLVTPQMTLMSVAYNNTDYHRQRKLFFSCLRKLLVIIFVGFIILLLVNDFVSNLLLGFSLTSRDLSKSSEWLSSYFILLYGFFCGGTVGALTSGAMYSSGETKQVSILAMVMYTISLPIKIYAFKIYGPEGLASVISISSITSTSVIGYFFLRNNKANFKRALNKNG
ncbi:hypothetical protein KW455_20540 [Vibrio fluvialis]|nr:hypothetical protein [Vibrio fluvialis]